MDHELIFPQMPTAEIRAIYQNHFGQGPECVSMAPARINLIGEHTDYNDGFVFPVAIDRCLMVAARRVDGASHLYSRQTRDGESFRAASVVPGILRGWTRYAAGVAWALHRNGKNVSDLDAYVDSNIPMGSGVSSSAALELAFGVIWNNLGRLGLANENLAHIGKQCENQFVGVNCGIMDQMAVAMGREGHAMFLDTRSLEIEYVAIPAELVIVLCDTKTPRSLSGSAYNERRSQCEEAARALGVEKLRDADFAMLEHAKDQMSETVYRRARHVISENERCLAFRAALGEGNLDELGLLMRASHESLRDDYEVSSPALDAMADAAKAAKGSVGARMTGAGFGGACVALVQRECADAFCAETAASYQAASGIAPELMVCRAVGGARMVLAS